LIHFVKEGEQF